MVKKKSTGNFVISPILTFSARPRPGPAGIVGAALAAGAGVGAALDAGRRAGADRAARREGCSDPSSLSCRSIFVLFGAVRPIGARSVLRRRRGVIDQPSPPTMSETIRARFSWRGLPSPTTRPRRMTTARSATSMTWSSACEMTITAVTSFGGAAIRSRTLRDSAPERGGGLVKDHDPRSERRGAGDGDGLALTARHQTDRQRVLRAASPAARSRISSVCRPHLACAQEYGSARQPGRPRELAPGVEVGRRIEVVEEREVLVDSLDSERPRRRRGVDSNG